MAERAQKHVPVSPACDELQGSGRIDFDLLPQTVDIHIDNAAAILLLPEFGLQCLSSKNLTGTMQEMHEQIKLRCSQG